MKFPPQPGKEGTMNPRICPNCRKEIPEEALYCESCQSELQPPSPDVREKQISATIANAGTFLAILAVSFAVIGYLIAWIGDSFLLSDGTVSIGIFFVFLTPFSAFSGAVISLFLILWSSIKKRPQEKHRAVEGFLLNAIILLLIAIIPPGLVSRITY
jgi:hypothetical protein